MKKKAELTAKWRKTPTPKTVRAKYQAAKRIKFEAVEVIRESEYINEPKQ